MKLKKERISAFAPATVANVGPGFDIFGLALGQPGDEIELEKKNTTGIVIQEITGDGGILPKDPLKNTATVALRAMLDDLGAEFGLNVKLHKRMPVGSGMGSSAASSVVGVYALNQILEQPLSKEKLLSYAVEGEKITSGGSVHLDNVAACLYGGFILVRGKNPPDIIQVPVPEGLVCVVVHPHIEIRTSESRRMLKHDVPLASAINQWGNIAGMIAALYSKDMELLRRSLKDVIAEPVRSILIPNFNEMKQIALDAGALGFSISGSGPSVFALCKGRIIAEKTGNRLSLLMSENQIKSDLYISPVNTTGPIELA